MPPEENKNPAEQPGLPLVPQPLPDKTIESPSAQSDDDRRAPPPLPSPQADGGQAKRMQAAIERSKLEKTHGAIKSIRTYQSDMAETIQRDNVSVIKMALAEKKRQEAQGLTTEAQTTEKKKSIIYIALSGVLVLAGLFIIGYFIFSHNYSSFVLSNYKGLIYAEKNTEVKLDRADSEVLASDINKAKIVTRPKFTIENLIVTEKDVGEDVNRELGARHIISGARLISLLNTDIPGPLFRSIQTPYMLGSYQSTSGPELFLILKTDSYEIAYPGMLEWERTLSRDVALLFSLASTTKPFEDRIINNRDARVITDNTGDVIFLYSFLDPTTLVLAESDRTFKEVLDRQLKAEKQK